MSGPASRFPMLWQKPDGSDVLDPLGRHDSRRRGDLSVRGSFEGPQFVRFQVQRQHAPWGGNRFARAQANDLAGVFQPDADLDRILLAVDGIEIEAGAKSW